MIHSGPQNAPPQRREMLVRTTLPPHSQCASFSLKRQDRGRLIASWHEQDGFNEKTALNEYYVVSQFHPTENRIHGYIFARGGAPRHRFLTRELILQQMGVSLAADTQGKVYFVAFMSPNFTRFPVVEIRAIPVLDFATGTWSEPNVLKRVVLRCLGVAPPNNPITNVHSFVKNNRLIFDAATMAGLEGCNAREVKGSRGVGEEMIRLRFLRRTRIAGIEYDMVSWDITSRPSPLTPSIGTLFSQGVPWAPNQAVDEDGSPYAAEDGEVDLGEVYPKPSYYNFPVSRTSVYRSASTMDVDRYEGRGELIRRMPASLVAGDDYDYFSVFYADKSTLLVRQLPDNLEAGDLLPHTPLATHPYPVIPGVDDADFVPLGEYFEAPTVELTFKPGTTQRGLTIPAPRFAARPVDLDYEHKRYAVYYTTEKTVKKIVMLRYD